MVVLISEVKGFSEFEVVRDVYLKMLKFILEWFVKGIIEVSFFFF